MADWADILGQALAGGGLGFSSSRADTLEQQEAIEEEKAMLNLKRQFQIEDRLWEERMADVQWGREQQLADKQYGREQQLADKQYGRDLQRDETAFSRQKGLLEQENEYNIELQKVKNEAGGVANKLMFDMYKFGVGQGDKTQKRTDDITARAINNYNDYKKSASESGLEENPLSFENWTAENDPEAWNTVVRPGIEKTVTELIAEGKQEAFSAFQRKLGPGAAYEYSINVARPLIEDSRREYPAEEKENDGLIPANGNETSGIDFSSGREKARAASDRYAAEKEKEKEKKKKNRELAEQMRSKRKQERNTDYYAAR